MPKQLRIDNLTESNINDLIYVCSSKKLNDLIHQHGIKLKKKWLRTMLKEHGGVAKIAYLNDKPVAQILYYPEAADPTSPCKRENVLIIMCTYNPNAEARGRGVGTKLLNSLVEDAKKRRTCLGNVPCRFILARSFNTRSLATA
jgi:predicted GNAT family acetyltransferase